MNLMKFGRRSVGVVLVLAAVSAALAESPPHGWTTTAPRAEIRPAFSYEPDGGADGKGCFVIAADREGLDGCWTKSFPVAGGKYYRFAAFYKATGVELPRRSIVAEIHWRDAKGQRVPLDQQPKTDYLRGSTALAETEFPATKGTDKQGWTKVSDTYQAPSRASQAILELHLRWSAKSRARWSNIALTETERPKPRPVRLATVHYRPSTGKTPL